MNQYYIGLIDKYKEDVERLEYRLEIALGKLQKMEKFKSENPGNDWYLQYLIKANLDLERQYADQKEIIEQYQKHYQSYSHIYADYQKRMVQ